MTNPIAKKHLRGLFMVWLLIVAAMSRPAMPAAPERALPPVLESFSARVTHSKENLPAITQSAVAAANHIIEHPTALIDVPYGEQASFAEEILNRAGGLTNMLPSVERPNLVTPHDILVVSVRSWEQEQEQKKILGLIEAAQKKGLKVFLFASRAGMPEGLKVDYLLDNGAATGSHAEAPVNAIANVVNAWLWVCEYTAALTRKGKYPGVLLSILMPESTEHNAKIQRPDTRRFLGETKTPIPAGELAGKYLQRVDELIIALASQETQSDINRAADLIAQQLKAGKNVAVATNTHILMSEIMDNRKTPMKPFNVVWQSKQAFERNLKEDDLLVWFGYVGLRTEYEDYATPMRATKARFITSFVTDKNPENNAPDAVMHIEQHWSPPDAAVPVPFPPGSIAPISGVNQALLYRMLEDAVAERLK